jgi:dihydroorotate dehydrogenase electron transfer subunit
MQQLTATVVENRSLAPHTYVLSLAGCEALASARPGQFIMVRGEWGADPLLPRAFSILRVRPGGIAQVLGKAIGKATRLLELAQPGARLSLLGPLGSSFAAPAADRDDWLVAGGVGLAPLLMHAERAAREGCSGRVTMFYGGRKDRDLVLLDELAATGCRLVLATEDGARGHRGYVTGAVAAALDALAPAAPRPTLMACGPDPMLEAVARLAHARGLDGYLSLEGEMACGIGACLVCAVPCRSRAFRYACKDGPVLPLADLAGRYAAPSQPLP